MKKDHIRDYATEAFRYYASCGCKASEQIKKELYDTIYDQSKKEYHTITKGQVGSSTEYAAIAAERAMEELEPEILDIIAVEKTLTEVKPWLREAIAIVYFDRPDEPFKRGEFSERVRKAEISVHMCVESVYKGLRQARIKFARNRKLRA